MNEQLGVAVILSGKNSSFIHQFKKMYQTFQGIHCYTCHSTKASRLLALELIDDILVLNHTSFYHIRLYFLLLI